MHGELEPKCILWSLATAALIGVILLNITLFTPAVDDEAPSSAAVVQDHRRQPVAMSGFRAIFVTVPSIEVGKKLAHGLVSKKLAACVNIIPQITSVYEWEGKIEEDSELLLMIKTQTHHFDEIKTFVKENHPYSVPEVIALPIEEGSQEYLDWIKKVTGPVSGQLPTEQK